LDPEIRANYVARSTLQQLAAQYWRYGFWKFRMLLRYPETFRWRQVSGLFVLSWLVWGLLSIWFTTARWFLAAQGIIYILTLAAAGIISGLRKNSFLIGLGVPLAIATMHFSWGAGFLWSLVATSFDKIVRN
jgi:hypothetical protein